MEITFFIICDTFRVVFTGTQPKAGTGHKMQSVPVVFERYIVRDISLTYFWKCSLAHWNLIRHFGKARGSFWGNDLYDALVYERKFKSEYLERQINERLLKSEPSIVKPIENKSDLSKLSTFSESSIAKFIENQSEHLSKLTLYHLKKRATRRSRRAREPSTAISKRSQQE